MKNAESFAADLAKVGIEATLKCDREDCTIINLRGVDFWFYGETYDGWGGAPADLSDHGIIKEDSDA